MSNTVKITLAENEYTPVFALASKMTGEKSKFAGIKIMEIIREAVQAAIAGAGKNPEALTIEVSKKILDGYFIGVTEVCNIPEVGPNDLIQIKAVCKSLKMRTRFENLIESVLVNVPECEESFDDEVVETPLDID